MFSLLYCRKAIKICATLQAFSLLNQPLYYYLSFPLSENKSNGSLRAGAVNAHRSCLTLLWCTQDKVPAGPHEAAPCRSARSWTSPTRPVQAACCPQTAPQPEWCRQCTGQEGFEKCHISVRNQREEAWKAWPLSFPELRLWLAAGTRPKLHLKCFR